jgi:hypothetical protein
VAVQQHDFFVSIGLFEALLNYFVFFPRSLYGHVNVQSWTLEWSVCTKSYTRDREDTGLGVHSHKAVGGGVCGR